MDKQLKAKWVKALLSGRYRQAEGRLWAGDNKFCCLGVLCIVAGATREELRGAEFPSQTERFSGVIDKRVAQKFAKFNDDEHMPFELIAGIADSLL